MATVIAMPAYSATMETGKLLTWLVAEGDPVEAGQVIAEIETDKAVAELEAPGKGRIQRILVPPGDEDIPVNTGLAVLLAEGETDPGTPAAAAGSGAAAPVRAATAEQPVDHGSPARAAGARIAASPAARHLAREAGIALDGIPGSGPGGRITKQDVLDRLQAGEPAAGTAPVPASSGEPRPVPALRRAIARAMVQAKTTVPHFYVEVDLALDRLLAHKARAGVSLTVLLVAAAARALQDVPQANRCWTDAGIVTLDSSDIGVAVAVDDGVIVPVVRDAHTLTLAQIARALDDLAARARAGALQQTELGNASLTVSNLGMHGIDRFFPIVNPPEPMILGFGRARRVPYVVDDLLGIHTVASCTASVDHRLVDGVLCARFLDRLRSCIEDPARLGS